mgnify:CR=1 FL=1
MIDTATTSAPEPTDPNPAPVSAGSPPPWRAIAAAGIALTVVAVLAAGVYLGWRAAAHQPQPEPSTSILTVAADPYAGAAGQVEMPDLRGLTRADAVTVLSDAGIPSRVVTVTDVPWAGATGLVVGQTPLFGTTDPTAVTLRIAAPATIPTVIGATEDAALTALEGLGTRVEVTRRYRPGTTPGTVLSVTPAPGKPVPDSVTLVTAAEPDAIFLDQVSTLDGYCSTGSATVNGTDYTHAVNCNAGPADDPAVVSYSLRRGISTVTGTAGIDDSADPAASATLTIRLDGKALTTVPLAYGKPVALNLSTAGGLRLELSITSTNSTTVTLADVTLLGDPAVVAKLGTRS